MNREPVWLGWAATVVVALAARYGLQLTDEQAGGVALAAGTLVAWAVRRYVTPVTRPRAVDGTPLVKALSQPVRPTRYEPPPRHARQPDDPLE